jgi:hypothetical protein
MTRRLILITLLGCASVIPARAVAQDPDSARATFERFTLCQGAEVQVSTTFADRHRGTCVLQDRRLLVIHRDGAETPILYTAVDSIWERGPGTRAGARTGAWIGGGMGGALGALFVAAFCEYRCGGDYVTHTAGGVLLGALGGAAVGGTIGREIGIWIRRYPR